MTETERLGQAVWFADEHARGVPGHTPQRYEDAGGLVQYRCDTCRFDTAVTWEEFCTRGELAPEQKVAAGTPCAIPGYFEVSVWHYSDDRYSVDTDRGHGSCTVYETGSMERALGVADYLESTGRHRLAPGGGEFITNEGEPFTGSILHWDCGHD